MQITYHALGIFLLIIVFIMAYCSTTISADITSSITHRRRTYPKRSPLTKYKVKEKTSNKAESKTKYGHKQPSMMKSI